MPCGGVVPILAETQDCYLSRGDGFAFVVVKLLAPEFELIADCRGNGLWQSNQQWHR